MATCRASDSGGHGRIELRAGQSIWRGSAALDGRWATWTRGCDVYGSASQGPGASGPYIAALAVQPHQANPVMLAAVQGTDYAAGGSLPSGVWRSTDGGDDMEPRAAGRRRERARHLIRPPMCVLIRAMPSGLHGLCGAGRSERRRGPAERRVRTRRAMAFIFRRMRE